VCVNQALTVNNTVFNMKITFGGIVKALGGVNASFGVKNNFKSDRKGKSEKKESGVLEFPFYTPD
jgi:hypothetical protein